MKRCRLAGFVIVVMACGLIAHPGAQVADRAEVLFQAARTKQIVESRLEEAIQLYQQVVQQSGANRVVAGKALLGMAQSYEKLGRPEARERYLQIVKDYGNQPEVAREARIRAAALAPAKQQTEGLAPRKVMTRDSFRAAAISPDGRLMVGIDFAADSGDLLVLDTATGQSSPLVAGSPSSSGNSPRFSADGRQVAYQWVDRNAGPQDLLSSLRVVGIEPGAKPRTLFGPDAKVSSVGPADWSADGKAILCHIRSKANESSIAWISTTDGAIRTIKNFEPGQFIFGLRASPDGGSIAYSAGAFVNSNVRHIYVIDANGQNETGVVKIAGANTQPIWTPDGSHILFLSDRSGTRALWSVAVQNGKPAGEPTPFQDGFGTGFPIGMTRGGDLYYTQARGGGNMTFIAERGPTLARIVQTFQGMSASWSPDGKSLAFVRQTPQQPPTYDLIVRSVETGEERLYPHQGVGPQSPRWLHDGSGLLVHVQTGTSRSLCPVDVKTGEFKQCFVIGGTGVGGLSPDDRTYYRVVRERRGAGDGPDNPFTGIVGVDPATGAEAPLATFPGTGLLGIAIGLALSPDGATFALDLVVDLKMQQAKLMTIRVDGTGYHELYGPFPQHRPWDLMRWTPDGQSILFVTAEANGSWRVMRIPATGGQPVPDGLDSTKLTGSIPLPIIGTVFNIDLSPDGSRIVFGAGTSPTMELWALDALAVLNARR